MRTDLTCPVCKAPGVPITRAAWIAAWSPAWRPADTRCRACGARVRFPVAARPVGWLLILPGMALIGAELYYVPALAFVLAPLTVLALMLVPPLLWPLRPVLREGDAEGPWDGVCPACDGPGVPYARVVWELWVVHGRTRCTRCGALVRLSEWTFLLAPVLFAGAIFLVLAAWAALPGPLAIVATVALPLAWLVLPPRMLRLHPVRKRT